MKETEQNQMLSGGSGTSRRALQAPPQRWNRREVTTYLLPVLKYRDALRQGATGEELSDAHESAMDALTQAPVAYGQLLRVYRRGSDEALDQWFGGIDCDDELLGDVFDYVEEILEPVSRSGGNAAKEPPDYRRDAAYRALFRVTVQGKQVDLFAPFEEYYFCDASACEDHRYRRVLLARTCEQWVETHLNFYVRTCAWYRENVPSPCADGQGLRPESHAAAAMIEQLLARCDYRRRLSEQRQALEYERGGLGWFHRDRKYQIAEELRDISHKEMELRWQDAKEEYEAYCEPLLAHEQAWQLELDRAPVTAFARKKELKEKLASVREQMESFRQELQLDELDEAVRRHRRGH